MTSALRPYSIPMALHCPKCNFQHVDKPNLEEDWLNMPHRTHLCAACGHLFKPANVPTVGVRTLPPDLGDWAWMPRKQETPIVFDDIQEVGAAK